MTAPRVLEPAPADGTAATTTRGTTSPRAIAWFGFSAFWGHMRHLVASAIATENVDSRKWMIPDEPRDLAARVLSILRTDPEAPDARLSNEAPTLLQSLGRELWIDFVADTGGIWLSW